MQKRDVKFKFFFVNEIKQAFELMLEPVHIDILAVAIRVDMRFELSTSVRSVLISIDCVIESEFLKYRGRVEAYVKGTISDCMLEIFRTRIDAIVLEPGLSVQCFDSLGGCSTSYVFGAQEMRQTVIGVRGVKVVGRNLQPRGYTSRLDSYIRSKFSSSRR